MRGDAMSGPWEEEDLDSVRERYLGIFEEQILLPLHRELTARQQRMRQHAASPDAEVRDRARHEAAQLPVALAVLEDVQARARHVKLSHLQALLGGPAPTW